MAKAKARSSIGGGSEARRRHRGRCRRRLPLDGEGLARDPVAMGGDRGLEVGRGAVAHANPVGVVEAGLLARRLQAVDHLARPALGDELRGEPRIEGDEQLAVVGGRHALLFDQPDFEVLGQQLERLAVDRDLDPAVARQGSARASPSAASNAACAAFIFPPSFLPRTRKLGRTSWVT